MFGFEAAWFALAGAVAAGGPILIHLLNRRRFRVVDWAAMDFLRQAMSRNRKILQVRDLLLLLLRVLCVLLFGAALARPFLPPGSAFAAWQTWLLVAAVLGAVVSVAYAAVAQGRLRKILAAGIGGGLVAATLAGWQTWGRSTEGGPGGLASNGPVHAVLVVDNSRSMGARLLSESLLDRAKAKAREFIEALPLDSRVNIIPLCAAGEPFAIDPYRNREDARRALDRIAVVDLAGVPRFGLEMAKQACDGTRDLAAKRVVFLTDLQKAGWDDAGLGEVAKTLPDLQVVPVQEGPLANVWVADFHLEDGIASVDAPARFLARIQSAGPTSDVTVQARLLIDGTEVASQAVTLVEGQSREVEFQWQFDAQVDPTKAVESVARLEIQPDDAQSDQLAADNDRQIVVPILAAVPILFIDQYGTAEDLQRNRIGETYALRHLLAPRAQETANQRQLYEIVRLRMEELTLEHLETARLVVVAGVERPGEQADLLREYVEQGGQLAIFAGGEFDAGAWHDEGWKDGAGILPCGLLKSPWGATPEESSAQLKPFSLAFPSLQHDYFLVEQEDREALQSLYESVIFFKAVQCDVSPETLAKLYEHDLKELRASAEPAGVTQTAMKPTADGSKAAETKSGSGAAWWAWRSPLAALRLQQPAEQVAKQWQPRVMARFTANDLPWLVERQLGAGRVAFFSSGVSSNWNLLRSSAAMYVFHRIFSDQLRATLPAHNFETGRRITLPLPRGTTREYRVARPDGTVQPLDIEALSGDLSGLVLRNTSAAGTYRVGLASATATDAPAESSGGDREEIWVSTQAPAGESDLTLLDRNALQTAFAEGPVAVLDAAGPIRVSGGGRQGETVWKWLVGAVIAGLLLEMGIVASSSRPEVRA